VPQSSGIDREHKGFRLFHTSCKANQCGDFFQCKLREHTCSNTAFPSRLKETAGTFFLRL
ncbi:hypothetical protein A2U01_0054184, partial [Trifolium medium]|nr:hypothetical protein [Trifolium medium]